MPARPSNGSSIVVADRGGGAMGWKGRDVVWKHAARNDRRQTSATAALGDKIVVEWDGKHEEIRGIMKLAFQGFLLMLMFSGIICVH